MNILILGGTVFVGRHLVTAAQARGHQVTLFNRGKSNPTLFSDVEQLRGDRDGDLSALAGRKWDAVIDTCGYLPRIVKASANYLADQVGCYLFISTISVYADYQTVGIDETYPLAMLEDETIEEITGETYGGLKVLCEQAVADVLPNRALNVRPGLIVGPNDPTDRFSYWVHRVAQGNEVLMPPDFPFQVIDGRDLAAFSIHLLETGKRGNYNATGPDYQLMMHRFLAECRHSTTSNATFTQLSESFLLENDVKPWIDLPLWMPGKEYVGFGTVNIEKAINDGLTFRPIRQTISDSLAWLQTRNEEYQWRAGISTEHESALLTEWHSQNV